MPKAKLSISSHFRNYVSKYENNIFSSDGKVLFCTVCDVEVSALKQFTVEQPVNRETNILGKLSDKKKKNQKLNYC